MRKGLLYALSLPWEQALATIRVDAHRQVRISAVDFAGRRTHSLRIYHLGPDGGWRADRHGLDVAASHGPEIAAAWLAAAAKAGGR